MECEQTRELCRVLERQRALTYPLVGSKFAPKGWPDRYVAYYGEFGKFSGFLEFKAHNGTVEPHQKVVIAELRIRAVPTYVVRFSADWLLVTVEGEATGLKYNQLLPVLCSACKPSPAGL